MGRACRNSARSAADRFNKIMKHTVCKVVTVVFVLLPVFGLFGCGGGKKYTSDDVVLINTAYYGTEMNPVYSFALKKRKRRLVILCRLSCGKSEGSLHLVRLVPDNGRGCGGLPSHYL